MGCLGRPVASRAQPAALGRLTEAAEILEESLRIAGDVELWNTVQWVAGDLGLTHVMLDRGDDAERCFDEAERVATRYGLPAGRGLAHLGRGHLARRAGDTAAAREHFRQAVRLCEQVGSPALVATALSGLGYVEESVGHLDRAAEAHHQVLELARTARVGSLTAPGLEGLAGVAAARGDAEGADELGRAAALRARSGQPPHALEQPDIERIMRRVEEDLGSGFRRRLRTRSWSDEPGRPPNHPVSGDTVGVMRGRAACPVRRHR